MRFYYLFVKEKNMDEYPGKESYRKYILALMELLDKIKAGGAGSAEPAFIILPEWSFSFLLRGGVGSNFEEVVGPVRLKLKNMGLKIPTFVAFSAIVVNHGTYYPPHKREDLTSCISKSRVETYLISNEIEKDEEKVSDKILCKEPRLACYLGSYYTRGNDEIKDVIGEDDILQIIEDFWIKGREFRVAKWHCFTKPPLKVAAVACADVTIGRGKCKFEFKEVAGKPTVCLVPSFNFSGDLPKTLAKRLKKLKHGNTYVAIADPFSASPALLYRSSDPKSPIGVPKVDRLGIKKDDVEADVHFISI